MATPAAEADGSEDPHAAAPAPSVHGTCVACSLGAVLLRGPSGAGKSDLALRLIGAGPCGPGMPPGLRQPGLYWQLLADDRVLLHPSAGALIASCPPAIAGRLEVRGVGVITVPAHPPAALRLIVDLVPLASVPRFPAIVAGASFAEVAGHILPRVALHALEPSAPLKVMLALAAAALAPVT